MSLLVSLYHNGRSTERPYNRYSFCCTTTDARPSVPTTVTRFAVPQRTLDRASLHVATRLALTQSRSFNGDGRTDRLDRWINNFIAENNIEVIDIKYSTAIFGDGGTILSSWVPSAMLIYRERETSDTEEE